MKLQALWGIALLVPILAAAENKPVPPTVIEWKNACPYRGCSYGSWRTTKDTALYKESDSSSPVVARLNRGEPVTAITGNVYFKPTKFKVVKPHGSYKPGDVILFYSYLGEGRFRAWHNGIFFDTDHLFSPFRDGIDWWNSPLDELCDKNDCWGKLETPLQATWWIQIKTKDGTTGWSSEYLAFEDRHKFP